MGEAKRKIKRLQRMQNEQPWCVYCGGTALGNSIDHMPPITICDLRLRPSGLEFLACEACHEGTRKSDQVAGVICRCFPDATTDEARKEVRALMKGLANNQPEILLEWKSNTKQDRFARNAGGAFQNGGALNIGEKTHLSMLKFGARAAAALHYEATKKIVPSSGAIWVTWHTNERLIKGDFPAEFADMLPPATSLRAGRNKLDRQFDYSSRVTDDGLMSAHMMTFRLSFAVQAAVTMDVAKFERMEAARPELIFRPGFLKEATSLPSTRA